MAWHREATPCILDQGVDASGLLRCRFMSLKSLKLPAPSLCLSQVETTVFLWLNLILTVISVKHLAPGNRLPRDSLFFFWQEHIEAKTKFLRSRSFPGGEGLTQAAAFSLKSKLCSAMNGHQRSCVAIGCIHVTLLFT